MFLAKRENNPLRDNILVNTRQCKHFPGDPERSIALMEELGRKLAQDGRADKTTVVIAFAETATTLTSFSAAVSTYPSLSTADRKSVV